MVRRMNHKVPYLIRKIKNFISIRETHLPGNIFYHFVRTSLSYRWRNIPNKRHFLEGVRNPAKNLRKKNHIILLKIMYQSTYITYVSCLGIHKKTFFSGIVRLLRVSF